MFSTEDLQYHKALREVILGAKIEVEGKATIMVASLFKWYDELGKKIQEAIPKQKAVESKLGEIKPTEKMGNVKKIGDK